jgi:hypothetical protein
MRKVYYIHKILSIVMVLTSFIFIVLGICMQFVWDTHRVGWGIGNTFFIFLMGCILLRVPFIHAIVDEKYLSIHIWPFLFTNIGYGEIKSIAKIKLPFPCSMIYYNKGGRLRSILLGPLNDENSFLQILKNRNDQIIIV